MRSQNAPWLPTFCLILVGTLLNSPVLAQSNNDIRKRSSEPIIFGEIIKISGEERRAQLSVEENVSDAVFNKGAQVEIGNLISWTLPDEWHWADRAFPYTPAPDDYQVTKGKKILLVLKPDLTGAIVAYPARVAERFRAIQEFKAERAKIELGDLSTEVRDELVASLKSDLREAHEVPFWQEYREGAVCNPRIEELVELAMALESKTGLKIIEPMMRDQHEPLILRTAIASHYAKRNSTSDSYPMWLELISELRKSTKTAQEAIALLALLDLTLRKKPADASKMESARELIRSALDPARSTGEYRIAFSQRLFAQQWLEPFQQERYQVAFELLQVEACDPKPLFLYPPRDEVGDWLIFNLVNLGFIPRYRVKTKSGVELSNLHPSVKAKLQIPTSAAGK